MYQNNPTIPVNTLPTMYDLPSESPEEMGLPSAEGVSLEVSSSACPARDEFHDVQPDLLKETCRPAADDFFMGTDLNLYYDVDHTGWYKRPDYFLVIGAAASKSAADARLSYVMWQEQVKPFLMVELLSPGTEAEDLGQTLRVVGKPPTKWQVYEQVLEVPYYAVFDRYSKQFRMFYWQAGQYVEATISGQGFWFGEIDLGLGVWVGSYQGMVGEWLRWYDQGGKWISTYQESELQANLRADREQQLAEEARAEADRERQRANEADRRAELLSAKLRELGIDVD
jgi:Uma2 family endonuclease